MNELIEQLENLIFEANRVGGDYPRLERAVQDAQEFLSNAEYAAAQGNIPNGEG